MSENNTTQWASLDLDPGDLERIQNSGVTPETAAARGYRTVRTSDEMPAVFNQEQKKLVPALLIPVWGVDPTDEPITYESRPHNPRVDGRTARNGAEPKVRKYEFPAKAPKRLDVPKVCQPLLGDPNTPLWITEGARKADAAASRGMCAVSIAGVWAFRSTNVDGGKVELPDWEKVAFNNRAVYIAFDSDVMTKVPVRQAIVRLAGMVKRRGGFVHVVVLPAGPRGEKQGLDDLIGAGAEQDDLILLVDTTFLDEEDNRGLDERLLDYITDTYELGQDTNQNPFGLLRGGPRIVRMLTTGSPSMELEAPARFRLSEADRPLVSRKIVKDVLPYVQHECLLTRPQELHLRTAPYKGGVVIDMGRDDGAVIMVTAEGWKVVEEPGADFPLFRRSHQIQPLPDPVPGGSLEELRNLVHVTDEHWPLIKGWLIGCVFGWVPRPWLYHEGPQGSGKSDAAVKVLSVVDPRDRIASFPKKNDKSDPGAVALNTYLMGWDNLTAIPADVSDWLCATVTGNQDERKVLYTTSNVQTFGFMRSGVITGVAIRSFRPDLLERLVKVPFSRLAAGGKRKHADLNEEFRQHHPRILGALLDAVSIALAHQHLVPSTLEVPRMVDYATLLKAYDLGVGGGSDLFGAYRDNVYTLLADSGSDDAVGAVVLEYMTGRTEPVKKTPSELYGELTKLRNEMGADPDAFWPKSAKSFSQALTELVAALEKSVTIEHIKSNGVRYIRLTLVSPSQPATEGGGGQGRTESCVPVASLGSSLTNAQVTQGFTPSRDARDASSSESIKQNENTKECPAGVSECHLPFGSYGVCSAASPCVPVAEFSQVKAGTQNRDADGAGAEANRATLFDPPSEPSSRTVTETPAVSTSAVLPRDWVELLRIDAPELNTPRCRECQTPKVPDTEMSYFRLCPNCTTGTLRPEEG